MNQTEDTLDLETSWKSQDALSTYQIITFIWSILCIIPNGILIHILLKKTLRRSHLYLILLNWSVCNVVLISSTIHWTIVPLKYLSFKMWDLSYTFSLSFITLNVILVTLFVFERYIKKPGICRYIIIRFWGSVAILAAVSFVSFFVSYAHIILVVFSIGIVNIVCIIILIVKIMLLFVKAHSSLGDHSCSLRLTLATIYVTITFIDRCLFVAGYHWVPLFELLKVTIFTDGFINLSLLVYFDETIKNNFLKLFRAKEALDPVLAVSI